MVPWIFVLGILGFMFCCGAVSIICTTVKNAKPIEIKTGKVISKRWTFRGSIDDKSSAYFITLEFEDTGSKNFEFEINVNPFKREKLFGMVKESDKVKATIRGKEILGLEVLN